MNAICSICGTERPVEEFYASALRRNRSVGQCKACVKARVRARRVDNLEHVRAYDRDRALLPHRIANAVRVTRNWRQKHRERQSAHNAAARAVLTAPAECEGCSRPVRVEKHHPDYAQPLLVIWLCKPCHAIADKIRRRMEKPAC